MQIVHDEPKRLTCMPSRLMHVVAMHFYPHTGRFIVSCKHSSSCKRHDGKYARMQVELVPMNTIFVYWRNIYSDDDVKLGTPHRGHWAFDGYPIQKSVVKLMIHCLAHEIIHAMFNALSSRQKKLSIEKCHTQAFCNALGTVFGHPGVPEDGSWATVACDYTLRQGWINMLCNRS